MPWLVRRDRAPHPVQTMGDRAARRPASPRPASGTRQYFTDIPAVLVGIHVAGGATGVHRDAVLCYLVVCSSARRAPLQRVARRRRRTACSRLVSGVRGSSGADAVPLRPRRGTSRSTPEQLWATFEQTDRYRENGGRGSRSCTSRRQRKRRFRIPSGSGGEASSSRRRAIPVALRGAHRRGRAHRVASLPTSQVTCRDPHVSSSHRPHRARAHAWHGRSTSARGCRALGERITRPTLAWAHDRIVERRTRAVRGARPRRDTPTVGLADGGYRAGGGEAV